MPRNLCFFSPTLYSRVWSRILCWIVVRTSAGDKKKIRLQISEVPDVNCWTATMLNAS